MVNILAYIYYYLGSTQVSDVMRHSSDVGECSFLEWWATVNPFILINAASRSVIM